MSFCRLTKGITPKICRLCVCVIINKRPLEPFMCLYLVKIQFNRLGCKSSFLFSTLYYVFVLAPTDLIILCILCYVFVFVPTHLTYILYCEYVLALLPNVPSN